VNELDDDVLDVPGACALLKVGKTALYAAAADPLVWEQHPESTRHEREVFARYFHGALESGGALTIVDPKTHRLIGSSRFTNHDPAQSAIEIGYTFLTRAHWGRGHNRELKRLMLGHAFQFVDQALFYVGAMNLRSQKAMLGIGAVEINRLTSPDRPRATIVYRITKQNWASR
jgi:RimJ/RimL family protein N-acetyltransferase